MAETVEFRIVASVDQATKAMDALAAAGVRVQKATAGAGASVATTSNAAKQAAAGLSTAANAANAAATAAGSAAKAAASGGEAVAKSSGLVAAASKAAAQAANVYADSLGATGTVLRALGPLAIAAGGAVAAVGAAFAISLRSGEDFNQSLANLSAITGATGKDLEFLRQKAIEFSRDSTQSAEDVAEAFKLVASAKPELLENAAALAAVTKEVITLSEASGLGLADAARATTNALAQFGAEADQAGRFVNVFAAAAKFGKAEIPDLDQAIVKAGTAAHAAGISFELTAATLEKLAEFGAPAEEFGTAFRNILIKLEAGAKDTRPSVVGLTQALVNLGAKGFGITELAAEFDNRNALVARQLIQTAEAAATLSGKLQGTKTAEEQAFTNTNTLVDQLGRLGTAFVNVGLAIQGDQNYLTSMARSAADAVVALTKYIEKANEAHLTKAFPVDREATAGDAAGALGIGATVAGLFSAPLGALTAFGEATKNLVPDALKLLNIYVEMDPVLRAQGLQVNDLGDFYLDYADNVDDVHQQSTELAASMVLLTDITTESAGASQKSAGALDSEREAMAAAALEADRLGKARANAQVSFRDRIAGLEVEASARDDAKKRGIKAGTPAFNQVVNEAVFTHESGDAEQAKRLAALTRAKEEDTAATRTHTKATHDGASEAQRAVEQADKTIAGLRAEAEARQLALAQRADEAETEALVAQAKARATGATAKQAQTIHDATLAAARYNEEIKKFTDAANFGTQLEEANVALEAQHAAFLQARASGASYLDIEEQLAIAGARAKGVDDQQADGLAALAQKHFENEQAAKADAAAREAIQELDQPGGLQDEIDLLQQVVAGTLSLVDAEHKLAVQREEAKGLAPFDAEQIVHAREEVEKLRTAAKDSVTDIGATFSSSMAKVVEGIALGTNKGVSFFEGLKQAGKATWASMLSGMIQSKLGFDLKVSKNFLNDIPGMVAQGASLMQTIFGGGLARMGAALSAFGASAQGSNSSSGSGFFGSLLGYAGSALGGLGSLFGGGAVGTAATGVGTATSGLGSAINAGVALASGNGTGILGNTSTIISIAQKLYSAYSAWSAGGSFGTVLNAGLGGFVTPLLDGLGTIAPGVASSLGGFLGLGGSAPGATSALVGGYSSVLGSSQLAIGGLTEVAPALSPALSALSTTITAVAPYLAIIGGVIATNTKVAALLNSDVYSRAFTLRDRQKTADGGWLDNFVNGAIAKTTTLGIVQDGESQFRAAQKTFAGEGSAGDIVQTILQVFTNLPQLIVAAFAASLPSPGTATRAAFEDWIEDARKHQKRAFNPFFGSVPVVDPATKQFVVAPGAYDRNLGQELVRDRLTEKYGSPKDTPDGAYTGTMRELIYDEGKALGLSESLTRSAIGLSVAFKSIVLGDDKGGNDIRRYLTNALELVANLRAAGASAGLSMQFIRYEVARLGDPSKVFNEVNRSLENGSLDAKTYREAIEGLANVYFKLAAEGTLEFDVSNKNGKGLKIAQAALDAIKGIIQDVPPGVQVATVAIGLLNDAITETGEQGPVTFQALKKAIDAAVASAQQLNPIVQDFAKGIATQGPAAQKAGTFETLLTDSTDAVIAKFGDAVRDAVVTGITNGFITASLNTGVLGPLQLVIDDAMAAFANSARTPEDLAALVSTIRTAGTDAVAQIELMKPAFLELGRIILDVATSLDGAADAANNAANSIVSSSVGEGFKQLATSPIAIDENAIKGFVTGQLASITATFEAQLRDATISALYDGFLKGLSSGALGEITERVSKAGAQLSKGEITNDQFLVVVAAAMRDAKLAVNELIPAITSLAHLGADIAAIFAGAAEDSAVTIATSIVHLAEAQKAFNESFDARIYALRNKGAVDPEALRASLPDLEKEFRLTQLSLGATVTDVLNAQRSGLITKEELPSYLAGAKGGPNELSPEGKLTALEKLRVLAEKDYDTRVAIINAELAAAVDAHQTKIKDLQDERTAIQETAQAAIEARQTELDALQEQIQTAEQWKGVLDTTRQTILTLKDQFESPQSRVANLQSEFQKQLDIFNTTSDPAHPDLLDAKRIEAANKLNQLGPQLLQLAQQSGLAQSSEAYRVLYDLVIGSLSHVADVAGDKTDGLEDKQQRALELQKEIKDIQEDSKAKLDAIDKSIKVEQDAIKDLQKAAEEKIQKVGENTAGVLAWIKGQGNLIFEAKQNALREKLEKLGVTSVDLNSIQTQSLVELQAIRRVLEGAGVAVNDKPFTPIPGKFGITASGQRELHEALPGYAKDGLTVATLQDFLNLAGIKDIQQLQDGGGFAGQLIDQIERLFPSSQTSSAIFRSAVSEIIHKIQDPTYVSPVLGFDVGGIARRRTLGIFGENGPEAVVPLSRFHEFAASLPPTTAPTTATAPVPNVTNVNVTVNISVDATLDLTDPDEVSRTLSPVIVRGVRDALIHDAVTRAESGNIARVSVQTLPRNN